MDTSVVQKLENLLLVAVPRDLTDNEVLDLRRTILRKTRQYQIRSVLLDFSSVDICDSFFGRFIQSTAQMAELIGAQVIVSGLQDGVIETMVGLGMTLDDICAVLDLDDALALSRTAGLVQPVQDVAPEAPATEAVAEADIEPTRVGAPPITVPPQREA